MKITDLFRKVETITPADAKKLIEGGKAGEIEILDVREPAEYEKGHIPGAKLVPLSILPSRLEEIESDKTTEVLRILLNFRCSLRPTRWTFISR